MAQTVKEFANRVMQRLRILTLLIVVASLAFLVRVGDAITQVRSLSGAAVAAEGSEKPDSKPSNTKAAEAAPSKENASAEASGTQPPADQLKDASAPKPAEQGAGKSDVVAPTSGTAPDKTAEAAQGKTEVGATGEKVPLPQGGDIKKWADASEADSDYSKVRQEMNQDLLQRRQQLDEREKALSQREALLDAAQKELDRKYQELSGLRTEIQGLLKTQSEEQEARISSLVKIYEGMKPKDAARIFNTLDTDVLLEVSSRMSNRSAAAIIAVMDSDRAKTLTTLLAQQKKLPDVPADAAPSGSTQ